MKRKLIVIAGIIGSGLLGQMLPILVNTGTNMETPLSHLSTSLVWSLIALGIALTIGSSIYSQTHSESPKQSDTQTFTSLQKQEHRKHLLAKIDNIWIKDILNQSLYHQTRVTLGLHTQPNALAEIVHQTVLYQGQKEKAFSPKTRILRIYDQIKGSLLILGEPGSGKTTMLLELLHTLLQRAERDEKLPIPIIFPLASWAQKRLPLHKWLEEELYKIYGLPLLLGREWLAEEHILPLFDGLDEVTETARAACIEAINIFQREHGLLHSIVCSRSTEYLSLRTKLHLQEAITIQPLSDQQLHEFFSNIGTSSSTLQEALRDDSILNEMITPLTLNMLALTYQDSPLDSQLLHGNLGERRNYLFTTYIQHMLKRHEKTLPYHPTKFSQWLSILAKQLIKHNQITFYLEDLRADWLPKPKKVRLFSGFAAGLLTFFIGIPFLPPFFGLLNGLLAAVIIGLVFGVCVWMVARFSLMTQPAEIMVWSWKHLWHNLENSTTIIVIIVLLGGLCFGLANKLLNRSPGEGLFSGLFLSLVTIILIGLILGFSHDRLNKNNRITPNQGFKLSARNGLFLGLVGLFVCMSFGAFIEYPFGLLFILVGGLLLGLYGGLLTALYTGWIACIQHIVIRMLLWRAGEAPLRYVRFLEGAVRCILLQRVGGGYIFVHRMLLDYFATLDTPSTTPTTSSRPQTVATVATPPTVATVTTNQTVSTTSASPTASTPPQSATPPTTVPTKPAKPTTSTSASPPPSATASPTPASSTPPTVPTPSQSATTPTTVPTKQTVSTTAPTSATPPPLQSATTSAPKKPQGRTRSHKTNKAAKPQNPGDPATPQNAQNQASNPGSQASNQGDQANKPGDQSDQGRQDQQGRASAV